VSQVETASHGLWYRKSKSVVSEQKESLGRIW